MKNNQDHVKMADEVNTTVIIRAMRHPANYKAIILCSATLISVGMLMIVLGLVIILIDHVELGPPHYDMQYSRYVGSSLAPIVGPMIIGFGSLIILGNIVLLGYATKNYYWRARGTTNIKKTGYTGSNGTRNKDIYGLV